MKKAIKKGLLVITLLFVLYNIIWYTVVNFQYIPYTDGMEEIYAHRTYALVSEDGYTYNVKFPSYLSFVGNLGIQKSEDSNCALIIWPKLHGEAEYGVLISSEDGSSYGVMLTRDQLPIAGTSDYSKQLVTTYQNEIAFLYEKADEMWNLDLS